MTLTKRTAWVMALCLVIAGSIPATLATMAFYPTVANNSAEIENNEDTNQKIISVLHEQCEADQRFRQQYKIRGKAEEKLLALFLSLATAQVEGKTEPPPTPEQVKESQQFLDDFTPLVEKIKILPVPDCDKQSERLLSAL